MSWSIAWSVALSTDRPILPIHQPQHRNLHLTNPPKGRVK